MALHRRVDLSVGRPPGCDWKRRPGRPGARWIDEIRRDSNISPVELWRRAVRRSHGAGATQRPTAGYATMTTMMMMICARARVLLRNKQLKTPVTLLRGLPVFAALPM